MIKKLTSLSFLAFLMQMVLGQGITGATYCDQTVSPYGENIWPAGKGTYKKQLLFFDLSGVVLSNTNSSVVKTVTLNGTTYTLTLSGFNATGGRTDAKLTGNDISTWGGENSQSINQYYNVNGGSYKEVLYTWGYKNTTITLNATITATKDGNTFPVDMVVFDSEATTNSSTNPETLSYTTNASNFSLLETLGSGSIGNNITGAGTKTLTYVNTQGSGVNGIYYTSGYSPSVTATMKLPGNGSGQAFGFAVRLYCDSNTDGTPDFLASKDTDGDGIPDVDDMDDDNDGIPDCAERGVSDNMNDRFALNSVAKQVFDDPAGGTTQFPYQVQLTPNEQAKRGQIWSKAKIDFANSFTLRYQAYLGNNDSGADGIAAVFHNDPAGLLAAGQTGFGIGARDIKNGIVLELDTFNNGNNWNGTIVGDISDDHGMIWDSDDNTASGILTSAVSLGNIEDGKWHDVYIYWDASSQTLKYTVQLGDGNIVTAGEHTFSNTGGISSYFGGVTNVWFGYTASTGGSTNDQRIKFVDLCSDLPGELDTDGDGIPDHLDLDSDGDGCPDSIEGSDNVIPDWILSTGVIDVANQGGVDKNGIPVIVNNGGKADADNQLGQGIGYSKIAATSAGCACVKDASTSGVALSVNHGITSLGRAGKDGWPEVRKGAWTALESKTKGFVINRVPTSEEVEAIADPQQGMLVYDEEAKCLKLYVLKDAKDASKGGFWKCLSNKACPDNFVNN